VPDTPPVHLGMLKSAHSVNYRLWFDVKVAVQPAHEPSTGVGDAGADRVPLALVQCVVQYPYPRILNTFDLHGCAVGAAIAHHQHLERIVQCLERANDLAKVLGGVRGSVVERDD
jgi:hypothetical protein